MAKAVNEYHARVLDKIGADMVVHPERDMGIRIAHKLVSRNILDYIELSSEFSLAEVRVTNPKFYNKTLAELNFRQRFGLTVVAIRRSKTEVIASPDASEIVRENDNLLVIGDTADVDLLDENEWLSTLFSKSTALCYNKWRQRCEGGTKNEIRSDTESPTMV